MYVYQVSANIQFILLFEKSLLILQIAFRA